MFDNVHVLIWVVCMMVAFFLGRWNGAIDKRRFAEAVAVSNVSYEEQIHLLKIKNAALENDLDDANWRAEHGARTDGRISFEDWCKERGMTMQEVDALPIEEQNELVLQWHDVDIMLGFAM